MRYYITIKKWKSNYPNPIKLEQNEIVSIKQKENDNPNWKGWIFCETLNASGWVPEQIINRINTNKGLIIEKYSAKEMNIYKGEIVIELKELNGWIWAKRKIGDNEGWLPKEILKEINPKGYDL